MFTTQANRLFALVLLLAVWMLLPGRANGQDKELTPEERKQLETKAKKLGKEALVEYQQRNYGEAVRKLEQSLTIWEKLHPKQDHPDMAFTLTGLGTTLKALGQAAKALPYLERALAMCERLYPMQDHKSIITNLDNLGGTLRVLGQAAKALPYHERALAMCERLYPQQDHPSLAKSLNNLGTVLNALGQSAKALPYLERALVMRQRLYPQQDHPDLANSLNNLGIALNALGQSAKALPHDERALAMRERLYPQQDHPDLANSLNNLGTTLHALGQSAKALPPWERALAMRERLYPKQDHPLLATSLNNLGTALYALGQSAKALPHDERALAMRERLYPKQDHPDLARSLDSLGVALHTLGQPAKALLHLERVVAMCERLYPKQDHPLLAHSLNNLGTVLNALGQPAKALPCMERALAVRERIYSKQDHPDLARSLDSLGGVLFALDQPVKALPSWERALAMYERLHSKQDHPDLAGCLENLGIVQYSLGQSDKALAHLERALAMRERLYPKQDHPDLAKSLDSLGGILNGLGRQTKALLHCERALDMYERLYPKQDHPRLANSLNNLAFLYGLGKSAKALPHFERALAMYRNLGEQEYLGEAQALARAAALPPTRDAYLSFTRNLPAPQTAYLHIWNSKAAITRILQDRHAAVRFGLDKNPEHQARWDNLVRLRGQRTFWILNPGKDLTERDQQIRQLTEQIEELERKFGTAFPEGPRRKALAKLGPTELAKRLPDHTAFIDILHYTHYEQRKPPQLRYLAFLLSNSGNIHRVELEASQPIDLAVNLWRQAVSGWTPNLQPKIQRELESQADRQAKELRRLVWEPLAKHLPKDTHTVYLALDGNLTRFPFAALPGSKPGTILLQELAIATVPHGPALLERLVYPPQFPKGPGNALLVGGLQYDPTNGKAKTPWHDLPATAQERDTLKQLAGKRPVLALAGLEASTARLRQELPKVRYAHLATHGFFKEDEFLLEKKRLAQQLQGYEFSAGQTTQLAYQGAQNPLVFTGLVLAGANAPQQVSKDGSLLVGDTIGDLRLEGLRLAVLSACETGLGDQTGGESVRNLQLAFHVAGCPDVVASLWQVNDRATAVLMAKFYHELWVKNAPPLEALRQAQLLVYLRPDLVVEVGGDFRSPDRGPPKVNAQRHLEVLEQGVRAPLSKGITGQLPLRTPTKLWAAFVLSGTGQ